ncbi:MAG: hypothetical protein IJL14_03545 [Selenomonadaceae bacterium]|nr:hypothetical protein [Selenomonadaceae bacterium]
MNWKKIFCGALAASMIFSASIVCNAAPEESANAKLAKIEIDTYGTEQSGAILDRISRLEKSYNGENTAGNMNSRIDTIYSALYENETEPSLLAKINALEWNVNHEVASGGIDSRLTVLENMILGKVSEGTFSERISKLAKESFGEEILPIVQVPIPTNLLVKVVTTVPVGSKVLQEGDIIPIKVAEDVFVDGSLVFANGLPGEGTVTNVHRAKNIFSNGKIEIDFNTIKAIDGQDVKVFTGIEAIDEMNAKSMARGLSLLGQTFSGKNSGIEEIFVRGKNIDLPAGIELYVQIKSPIVVYGVKVQEGTGNTFNNGGLSEDEMNITPPPPEPKLTVTEPPVTEPTTPPATEPEPIIERVDPEPPAPSTPATPSTPTTPSTPAPPEQSNVEPRPDEGKTLDGYDGEVIEIIDEE